jgi:hypothetical protein
MAWMGHEYEINESAVNWETASLIIDFTKTDNDDDDSNDVENERLFYLNPAVAAEDRSYILLQFHSNLESNQSQYAMRVSSK